MCGFSKLLTICFLTLHIWVWDYLEMLIFIECETQWFCGCPHKKSEQKKKTKKKAIKKTLSIIEFCHTYPYFPHYNNSFYFLCFIYFSRKHRTKLFVTFAQKSAHISSTINILEDEGDIAHIWQAIYIYNKLITKCQYKRRKNKQEKKRNIIEFLSNSNSIFEIMRYA